MPRGRQGGQCRAQPLDHALGGDQLGLQLRFPRRPAGSLPRGAGRGLCGQGGPQHPALGLALEQLSLGIAVPVGTSCARLLPSPTTPAAHLAGFRPAATSSHKLLRGSQPRRLTLKLWLLAVLMIVKRAGRRTARSCPVHQAFPEHLAEDPEGRQGSLWHRADLERRAAVRPSSIVLQEGTHSAPQLLLRNLRLVAHGASGPPCRRKQLCISALQLRDEKLRIPFLIHAGVRLHVGDPLCESARADGLRHGRVGGVHCHYHGGLGVSTEGVLQQLSQERIPVGHKLGSVVQGGDDDRKVVQRQVDGHSLVHQALVVLRALLVRFQALGTRQVHDLDLGGAHDLLGGVRGLDEDRADAVRSRRGHVVRGLGNGPLHLALAVLLKAVLLGG
mmetsp:Transcript_93259/g.263296  ORF Transcript_93259/g.263296 Transcript_93259/m.263296 type:complete len:389 (-) Transcript_93259:546-1712(-)